jgi:hypothetical protein
VLIEEIQDVKTKVLMVWARERGFLQDNGDLPDTIRSDCLENDPDEKHRRDQSQLYLLLYIEKLVRKKEPICGKCTKIDIVADTRSRRGRT